jgi:uncharacterized paraquat-inducible protein A
MPNYAFRYITESAYVKTTMSTLGLDDQSEHAPQQTADQIPRQGQSTSSRSKLGTCPDCDRPVSRSAAACPNCGCQFTTNTHHPTVGRIAGGVMLGYLGILLINLILFFLVLIFFAGSLPIRK